VKAVEGLQVPLVPPDACSVPAHAWQVPHEADEQQTPSTQFPLAHSRQLACAHVPFVVPALVLHVAPWASCEWQAPSPPQ
jgi:hypothetical protein